MRKNPNLLTDEELFTIIRDEFFEILPIGCIDFFKRRSKTPSLPYLRNRFHGTWNDILMMAGVPEGQLNFVRRSKITKEDYIHLLNKLAEDLGHTPTWKEYMATGYSWDRLRDLFGTYNKAVQEAGLIPNIRKSAKKPFSHQKLKLSYLTISNRVGGPATVDELERLIKDYSAPVYLREFGGIKRLRSELGLPRGDQGSEPQYTKKELVKKLIYAYQRKQGRLTVREIQKDPTLPAYLTILICFKVHSIHDVWNEIEVIMATEFMPLDVSGVEPL